jgi:pantoate--beta-alanine ligase
VFGEKDHQQLAIVRRMARDLDLATAIIGHPTVREPDGLALSSRNRRLTPDQRADAPRIHAALQAAAALFHAGERRADPLLAAARKHLTASPLPHIEYLELVAAATLQPVATIAAPAVLATAVCYDQVRLIDHIALDPRSA